MLPEKIFSLDSILCEMKANGYKIYDDGRLNIVGIRIIGSQSNSFNDSINVFYKTDHNSYKFKQYKATTDPGIRLLNAPIHPDGTAILVPDQYEDTWKIGLHRKKYEALVQRLKKVRVYRDNDRDDHLDFGRIEEGFFGINIHRAAVNGVTQFIGGYSAGCQVFSESKDFEDFMSLCKQHREKFGNSFTYTLLDEYDSKKLEIIDEKDIPNPKPLMKIPKGEKEK